MASPKTQNYTLDWDDDAAAETDCAHDLAGFRRSFELLRQQSPIKAVLLFLEYLGANRLDEVAEAMARSVLGGTLYLSILLDAESLPFETACQALPKLREADPHFCPKFTRLVSAFKNPDLILRTLRLAPALGDYSFLICWLRTLDQHQDSKIRSRAAKLLCRLRPTRGMIERQMQSRDPRVRAGAVEALWQSGCLHSDEDALALLWKAREDSHHRVVANALVGLHMLGDSRAADKMIDLSRSQQHLVRAAMAWALGMVNDPRAFSTLQHLANDRSFTVRRHAGNALRAMQELTRVS